MFGMVVSKSPGPDGFNGNFYQQNWDLLKEDMVKAIQLIFHKTLM